MFCPTGFRIEIDEPDSSYFTAGDVAHIWGLMNEDPLYMGSNCRPQYTVLGLTDTLIVFPNNRQHKSAVLQLEDESKPGHF